MTTAMPSYKLKSVAMLYSDLMPENLETVIRSSIQKINDGRKCRSGTDLIKNLMIAHVVRKTKLMMQEGQRRQQQLLATLASSKEQADNDEDAEMVSTAAAATEHSSSQHCDENSSPSSPAVSFSTSANFPASPSLRKRSRSDADSTSSNSSSSKSAKLQLDSEDVHVDDAENRRPRASTWPIVDSHDLHSSIAPTKGGHLVSHSAATTTVHQPVSPLTTEHASQPLYSLSLNTRPSFPTSPATPGPPDTHLEEEDSPRTA